MSNSNSYILNPEQAIWLKKEKERIERIKAKATSLSTGNYVPYVNVKLEKKRYKKFQKSYNNELHKSLHKFFNNELHKSEGSTPEKKRGFKFVLNQIRESRERVSKIREEKRRKEERIRRDERIERQSKKLENHLRNLSKIRGRKSNRRK